MPSARAVPRLTDGLACAASCSLLGTGGQRSQSSCQSVSARLTRGKRRRARGNAYACACVRVRVCFTHTADHVSIKAMRRAAVAAAHHVPTVDSIAFFPFLSSFFPLCSDVMHAFFSHLPVRFYVLGRQYDLIKRESWAQLAGGGVLTSPWRSPPMESEVGDDEFSVDPGEVRICRDLLTPRRQPA